MKKYLLTFLFIGCLLNAIKDSDKQSDKNFSSKATEQELSLFKTATKYLKSLKLTQEEYNQLKNCSYFIAISALAGHFEEMERQNTRRAKL